MTACSATQARRRLYPSHSRTHYHRWQHRRARERAPAHGTYGFWVSTSPEVSRVRFARFVERVLADARDRGMNDAAIHKVTTISPSTFHRWQRGDFRTTPDIGKVTAFCEGLGVPADAAIRALGVSDQRDEQSPEPAIEPDIRKIMRGLADPAVPEEDKRFVRELLKVAANRVTPSRRSS